MFEYGGSGISFGKRAAIEALECFHKNIMQRCGQHVRPVSSSLITNRDVFTMDKGLELIYRLHPWSFTIAFQTHSRLHGIIFIASSKTNQNVLTALLYIHCSTFLKFPVSLNNLHLWLNCTDIHFRRASINPERVPSNPSSVIHGAVSRVPGLIDLPFD